LAATITRKVASHVGVPLICQRKNLATGIVALDSGALTTAGFALDVIVVAETIAVKSESSFVGDVWKVILGVPEASRTSSQK
jgi:hypothetical protein